MGETKMGIIEGGSIMPGARRMIAATIGASELGVAAVLAAVQDTGAAQTSTTGIVNPDRPRRLTATAGGTAADIKAISAIVGGTDPLGNAISETLPAFTENTAGSVEGQKLFKTVTSVAIPAHDGTGATTSIGAAGLPGAADTAGLMAALQDDGAVAAVVAGNSLYQPDVPRNVTATAGGTSADIKAISVTVTGKNAEGKTITEDVGPFTVNTAGTVAGALAFAEITSVSIPAHDGTDATTSIGYGDIIGLGHKLTRNSVARAFLDGSLEGTAPTVVTDEDELEKNTVDLNSALDGTPVIVEFAQS
jgi:hypothetical protein